MFVFVSAASAAQAEQERKELGPHVHGQGSLAITVEHNNVQMKLVVPGMDIVGFEHEADTARQKRAVEAALNDLKDPLSLFVFPDTADCTVISAEAKLVAEEHDHNAAQAGKIEEIDEENHHAEFRATYALTCVDAEQIKSINFRFFDRFRDSWELDVSFSDAEGESAFAVSRNFRYMER